MRWRFEKNGDKSTKQIIAGIAERHFIQMVALAYQFNCDKAEKIKDKSEENQIYYRSSIKIVNQMRLAIYAVEYSKRSFLNHLNLLTKKWVAASFDRNWIDFKWPNMTIQYNRGSYTIIDSRDNCYDADFDSILTQASLRAYTHAENFANAFPNHTSSYFYPKWMEWARGLRSKAIDKYNAAYYSRKTLPLTIPQRWEIVRKIRHERQTIEKFCRN